MAYVQELLGDGQPRLSQAGTRSVGIAEGASPSGNSTIPIGASTACVQGNFLDTLSKMVLEIGGKGVISGEWHI